jgi:hypothetical protein
MKLTKSTLKQIIKEELQVILTNEEVEEMFGEEVRKQLEKMEESLARKSSIYKLGYRDNMSLDELREFARTLKAIRDYFKQNAPGGFGDKRFSDYYNRVVSIGKSRAQTREIDERKENNPWTICTASVGREDKEKYEKCVMDVKRNNKK